MNSNILANILDLSEKLKNMLNSKFQNNKLNYISLVYFNIFLKIYEAKKPVQMMDLAKKINRSKGDITFITKKLINEGLIEQIPDANDKRKKNLQLTQKSNDLIPFYLNLSLEFKSILETIGTENQIKNFDIILQKLLTCF